MICTLNNPGCFKDQGTASFISEVKNIVLRTQSRTQKVRELTEMGVKWEVKTPKGIPQCERQWELKLQK